MTRRAQQMQGGLESKDLPKCQDGMCKMAWLCCDQSRGGNNASKSSSPKNSWGRGATGNPNDGKATQLDSTRNEEQLIGQQGDGPSESEVIAAPEGEQAAARVYASKYQKFRSQAEAVLDSEPLPLGHRETVRQYFENIRPSGVSE